MAEWTGDQVPLSALIGDPLVEKIDYSEGEIIMDVFVIVRSMSAENKIGTSYTSSDGFGSDELRMGTLDLIHGRILRMSVDGWISDD